MKEINAYRSPAFFLGANTPEGFVSLFSGLYYPEDGWRLYILKGGPGTGKSSVMKRIAAEAEKRGSYCERIHCSSDPSSLDAVIIPGLKVSIADGTLPHALEPRFPGVSEKLVDLGEFRDDGKLAADREEIISKTLENSLEHKKCVGFLRAAAAAALDNRLLISEHTDMRKLVSFASRLADNVVRSEGSQAGKRYRRYLHAFTPEGCTVFNDTARLLCEKKTVLEDPYGVCAPVILKTVADRAVKAGLTVIECADPMRSVGVDSHILIPDLSVGIFTADAYQAPDTDRFRTVRCSRFSSPSVFSDHRNRLAFNRKAQKEFTAEAVRKLSNAKKIHDELEAYYIAAMDFDGVKQKTAWLIGEIWKN